ncbi:MAG: domain containing protein [Sphingobacteriales bacterium]|nr:domain containing protein [Sphingobacteriales bacterium]
MKTLKQRLSYLLILSALLIVACSKDSDNALSLQKEELGLQPGALENVLIHNGIPLNGGQEVPANTSLAKGSLDVSYNKSTKMLKYTLRWNSLTGNAIAAHIHGEAAPGVNAPVKHPIVIPLAMSGELTDSVSVDEVAIKEAGLLAGLYYVNIHTPLFPGGEIRAQINFDKESGIIEKKGIRLLGVFEVPANNSRGSGNMDIKYNKGTKMLTYTISWRSLTGNAIAAHIHGEAPEGVNAPVKHPISVRPAMDGKLTDSVLVDEIAIKEDDLLHGLYYVNIHTPLFPGGEIRAQIDFEKDCDVVIIKNGPQLCGAFEVPKNQSKAAGDISLAYNRTKKQLTYTITWHGLSGNAVAAHIHGEAPIGVNAPVKHPISIPATVSGTFTETIPIDGIQIKEAGLLGGLYYINIHTALFPGGELRGQL